MNRYISFSGGVESTTMCILYGKGATAIWVDTGAEHDVMYSHIDSVEQRLIELHKGDFKVMRLIGKAKHKGVEYEGLENLATAYKFMPSQQRRYCTSLFKIKPIDQFLSDKGECELMIGFNLDEQGRTGNLEKMPNINYTYPLIQNGLDRSDCEDILNLYGLHPKFPVYMRRGGCRMCFFKSEKEYKAMYHLNRKEFNEVMEFEKNLQDKRTKFFSIMSNGKSLEQLASECAQEMFTPEELYQQLKNQQEKACGAFCRR
jgi:3'-phosphoadenosine 5'-phosphosulfate sulfotransferase (PAPS reductase)/FAD synthetase